MLIIWSSADFKTLRGVVGEQVALAGVTHRVESDMTTFPPCGPEDIVLAMGSKALETLVALGAVPKNRTIGSLRERPFQFGGSRFFMSYDPGIVTRDYSFKSDIQWDVQLIARILNTGTSKPVLGDYRYVESYHELIAEVDNRFAATGAPVEVSCDLETVGTDEYAEGAFIVSISFSIDEGKSDVMYFRSGEVPQRPTPWTSDDDMTYWEGVWRQVHWLLTSEKVSIRGANFKFDSRWLNRHWGIDCTNQKFDTMLVGSLLDENRSNSLKLHAKIYTHMGGYEEGLEGYDKGRMDLIPPEVLLPYTGADTDVTLVVARKMKAELLKDRPLTNFYVKLVQPAAKAFERLERNGVLVDVPYYLKLKDELREELTRLEGEMIQMLPNKLRIKHRDSIQEARDQGKNPLKASILTEFLFTDRGLGLKPKMTTAKTGAPSTSADHLMMFEDTPEVMDFLKLYKEHTSASKTLSTYVIGFLKHLRSDGRFHPTYLLGRQDYGDDDSGTVTGRCVVGTTLIKTDKGDIPIRELIERGEQGETFKVLTHRNRWLPVTGFWRNGLKPVCTVKAQGLSLTSTYNHPYMSFPSWTLAEDLKLGSWLYSVVEPPKVEEWRPIKGWPYEVSNMGRVRRAIDGHCVSAGYIVSQRPKGQWGHLKVTLHKFDNGRDKRDFPVHKLVADAFLTNKGGVEIAHLNGDAACNWSTNLKWVSIEENKLHFRLHGTANRESQKKLDWEKVDAIRAGLLGDDHQAADSLGVSRELVRDVRLWKKWNGRREPMTGFAPVRVDSVSDAGVQETFDLTVDEDHSFVANGLVVHNTSAKDPAVQTVPKHTKWTKKLRRAFIAPPGYVILQLDYSQGELRITACVAEEPTMIKAYRDGLDLHAITASQLNGYEMGEFMLLPEETRDELRSGGKAGNFGLIYGMQHRGFRDYAYYSYGVKMTEEEAFQKREAFFALYSRLLEWHDEARAFAHRNEYIRSPLGRIRHLPLINSRDREIVAKQERQAINSPIQSCLSDMMQLAMATIAREYAEEDIHMFMMTHDSLALYVPQDDYLEWAKRLKTVMESLPLQREFGWNPPLTFIADAEYSEVGEDGVASLATLKKLKNL